MSPHGSGADLQGMAGTGETNASETTPAGEAASPDATGVGSEGGATAEVAAEAEPPPGPKLPEHGGLVGLLVESGTSYLVVQNPNLESGVPEVPEAWRSTKLPGPEDQLKDFLGVPHNFEVGKGATTSMSMSACMCGWGWTVVGVRT